MTFINRDPRSRRGKPTPFRGILYASRLEARWAAFFAELGIALKYLPFGEYGIDFYLPQYDKYLEIKSQMPRQDELRHLCKTVAITAKPALVVWGELRPGHYQIWMILPIGPHNNRSTVRVKLWRPRVECTFGYRWNTRQMYVTIYDHNHIVHIPLTSDWLLDVQTRRIRLSQCVERKGIAYWFTNVRCFDPEPCALMMAYRPARMRT